MQPNVNALAEALRAEKAAEANLGATQTKYEQAQQMANSDNVGGTFLSALGNNFERARGRRNLNELEPRLAKARETFAQNYGAGNTYKEGVRAEESRLQRARQAEADRREQQRLDYTLGGEDRAIAAEDRAGAEKATQNEIGAGNVVSVGTYIDTQNPDAPPVRGALTRGGGVINPDTGERLGANWVERGAESGSDRQYGGTTMDRNITDSLNTIGRVDAAVRLAQEFTPDDFQSLTSAETLKEGLKTAMSPEQFDQFIVENAGNFSPRVKGFMERVKFLGSAQRKEFFGAALTAMERADSQGYTPAATNAALEAIIRRLGMFDEDARMQIRNSQRDVDVPYTAYNEFITSLGDPLDEDTDYAAAAAAEAADPYAGFSIVE